MWLVNTSWTDSGMGGGKSLLVAPRGGRFGHKMRKNLLRHGKLFRRHFTDR